MNEDLFHAVANRIAKTHYVILCRDDKGNLTLLMDPGLNRPWFSTNKKYADFQAKACDGEARTYEDAFQLLKKAAPDFEKSIMRHLENAQKQTVKPLSGARDIKPIIDSHGNPTA